MVSGTIVRHGFPAHILSSVLARNVVLVVSPYLLAEYLDVLRRPHIVQKYKLGDRLDLFARFMLANAELVAPSSVDKFVPDDPKDDPILACAVQGHAQYIVTGDEHLLKIVGVRGLQILTPRDFVENVLAERLAATR